MFFGEGVFAKKKNFLSGKVSFNIGIFGCPQKFQLTSKNGHILQITKSKNRCGFFSCHVKKLSVQHSSSWFLSYVNWTGFFYTYKITSFTKKLIFIFSWSSLVIVTYFKIIFGMDILIFWYIKSSARSCLETGLIIKQEFFFGYTEIRIWRCWR